MDAFLYNTLGMFHYISDLSKFQVHHVVRIEAYGHDLTSLLHNFMDTCLSVYGEHDYFIIKDFQVISFVSTDLEKENTSSYTLTVYAYGDFFRDSQIAGNSDSLHLQGTEVKAITYSAMQIFTQQRVYTANNDSFNASTMSSKENESTQEEFLKLRQGKLRNSNDVFVIVDI